MYGFNGLIETDGADITPVFGQKSKLMARV
jgi:hypothetical protein